MYVYYETAKVIPVGCLHVLKFSTTLFVLEYCSSQKSENQKKKKKGLVQCTVLDDTSSASFIISPLGAGLPSTFLSSKSGQNRLSKIISIRFFLTEPNSSTQYSTKDRRVCTVPQVLNLVLPWTW